MWAWKTNYESELQIFMYTIQPDILSDHCDERKVRVCVFVFFKITLATVS